MAVGTRTGREVEFTDRDPRLILNSLPEQTTPEARGCLTADLRTLAKTTLIGILDMCDRSRTLTDAQRRQVDAVENLATKLQKVLSALDRATRDRIISCLQHQRNPGDSVQSKPQPREAAERRFDDRRDHLASLAVTARVAGSKGRLGRPVNLVGFLVLNELANMFWTATGIRPTRRVARVTDDDGMYDTGPFFDFAAAVWPVVFGNGDAGLPPP